MVKLRYPSTYGTILYTSEEETRKALLHLAIFYVYIILLTIVVTELTPRHDYSTTQVMRRIFMKGHYMKEHARISFTQIKTIPEIWSYLEHVVFDFFQGVVYDKVSPFEPRFADNLPALFGRILLNESILIDVPRLRQIRVKNDSCSVHPAFVRYFDSCYAPYSSEVEFKEPTYKGTKFKTMAELQSHPVRGLANTYKSGGYVQRLSYNMNVNLGIIRKLQKIKWLDRGSRLVLFEFTFLNLNLNNLQSIKLIFEIMPNGLVNPAYQTSSLYMNSLVTESGWFLYFCTTTVYLINFYYTYMEIKKLYLNGWRFYFSRLSVVLHLPKVIFIHISLVCSTAINLYAKEIYRFINDPVLHPISVENATYIYSFHEDILGFLVFLSSMSLLSYMDFNPVLRTIGRAMHLAATDLGAFTIMFLITFTAYGNLGLLLFGDDNIDFKDFQSAFITMVRILITDFEYFRLEADSRILGPIFFLSYILLMFFVLLNMFLAIIVLSYRTATTCVAYKPNFLWYYIRKQLYRLSCGQLQPPKYPEFEAGYAVNQTLDKNKVEELRLIKAFNETEEDLEILLTRLDLIEETFYRLTNNIDILITKQERNKKRKAKELNVASRYRTLNKRM